MTIYEQVLDGCSPVPLASYLKALGVFRLVAEQADPQARGFWRDERFVLRTFLAQDELVRFFVDRYEPSPIISPWNGRAGFLEGEEEGGERSSRQGAQLVRRYETAGKRFWKLRGAVETYRSSGVIKALDRARAEEKSLRDKGRKVPLTEEEKARLRELGAEIKRYKSSAVGDLRSDAPDWTIEWFDSCKRIGANEADMPLLGTGGNDGSRDFGMNFGAALSELYDFDSGLAHPYARKLVNESLGFEGLSGLGAGNLGLYEPGGAGENTTSGFVGEQPSNPFDFVVLLEGAMLFSGVTTRRLGSGEARLSFPFTVKALTAGSGAAKAGDDQSFAEFWAPLWTRPARLDEIQAFLAEGRTAVNGKTARDGLEFAVAVGTLGSQRGVAEFQRFALLQREPQNPKKATPLGRIRVRENPRASLIAELDKYDWLTRARRLALDKAGPASLLQLGRALDEALFRLAEDGSHQAVQDALIALGALAREMGLRPKVRENLPPPPGLSKNWVEAGDDGTHEFALAASVASLAAATDSDFRMPFRRHVAPLAWPKGRESWDDSTEARALAVWTGRNLVRDMAAVLERRLIEAQRHSFAYQDRAELPLRGRRWAPVAAVRAFITGNTEEGRPIDEERIASLATGLAWAREWPTPAAAHARTEMFLPPLAFATIKPLFDPKGVAIPRPLEARVYGPEDDRLRKRKAVDPLTLFRLVRGGRGAWSRASDHARRLAVDAGLSSAFGQASLNDDPDRFAAALLFPLGDADIEKLADRAYPDLTRDDEEPYAN